ncbi:MAG: ribulose-phosphate 3-epimerase [Solirubrobacteraceae bacterium]
MSISTPVVTATVGETVARLQIAPSILAADYARLGEQVGEVLDAGARVIHFDVMDGGFVPPITFGPIVVAALSDLVHDAGGVVDVHLMIERPERYLADFAAAGADLITIHVEATPHLHYALHAIHAAGCLAGLALNPGTPPQAAAAVVEMTDVVLCMTVNPGWGGQRFIPATGAKLKRLREMLPAACAIEVDGGVGPDTAAGCVQLGANLLVAGSAIFGSASPGEAYRELVVRAAGGMCASERIDI